MEATKTYRPQRVSFSLSTLVLVVILVSFALYLYLHQSPWAPAGGTLNEKEFEALYPNWFAEDVEVRLQSPDKTRQFSGGQHDWSIYDSSTKKSIFDFTIRDYGSEIDFIMGWADDSTPIHWACGFIDDNTCAMGFYPAKKSKSSVVRIWKRRFPEWWWGHFYRPEVWVAVVFAAFICMKVSSAVRDRLRITPEGQSLNPNPQTPQPGTLEQA